MKKMKRGVSLFLSTVLVLGMLPVQSLATECAHQLTYSAEGDSIVETCSNEGCNHRKTATLTLDPEASLAYTGEAVEPLKVTYSNGWLGRRDYVITYVNNVAVTAEPEADVQKLEEPEQQSQEELPTEATEETEPLTEEEKLVSQAEEEPEEPKIPAGTLTIEGVSVTKTFKIEPIELKILWDTLEFEYDSGAHRPAPTAENVVTGEKVELVVEGMEQTAIGGNYEVEVTGLEGEHKDNYKLPAETKKQFAITPRVLEIDWGTLAFPYDGKEHIPGPVIKNAVAGEAVELVVTGEKQKTVGDTYAIEISLNGADKDNYELPETQKQFAITSRVLEIDWGKLEFEYDGNAHIPTPEITNLVEGDEVILKLDPEEEKTAAGTYEIRIVSLNGIDAGNYDWPKDPQKFTISLPAQEAPTGVTPVAETILGKADGKITGVNSKMKYKNKADGEDVEYTPITGEEITGLAAGTYLVRYAEIPNEKAASEDVEVTVAAGAPLRITLPAEQTGYTLTLTPDETEVGWQATAEVKFELDDRYTKGEDFAVKVNGEKVTLNSKGTFTISKMEENKAITVEGVYPLVAIKFLNTTFTDVVTDVTFGSYLKQSQTLEIETPLAGQIFYAEVQDKVADPSTITEWKEYTEPVTVPTKEGNAVIYAKITTDKDEYYASTNGVILDTTAPVIKINGAVQTTGKTYYTTQSVTVTDTNLTEVRLNGVVKTQPITLAGNTEKTYIVRADDAAGNQNQITVKMQPIATLKESVAGLNSVDTILSSQCANATTAEKTALQELKTNKAAYLVILQIQALPEADDIKPYNEEHRDAYKAAQDAYDKLTTEQKKLVAKTETDHLSEVKDALAYKITTDEDDLQWEKKSKVDLVIKVNGPKERFKELQISSKAVATTKYTVEEDTYGTKITIDEAYLETLTTGKKTVKVVYTDGETDGKDQIEILKAGSTNPKTGDDGILFWMTASVLSLACLAVMTISGRKRRYQA